MGCAEIKNMIQKDNVHNHIESLLVDLRNAAPLRVAVGGCIECGIRNAECGSASLRCWWLVVGSYNRKAAKAAIPITSLIPGP